MSPVGLCLPGRARWPWVGAQSRGWPAPGPHRPPFPPAARLGLPGSISGHLFASTGDTIDSPEPCCSPAGHTGPSRFTRGPTAGGPSPALPDSIQEPPGKTRPAEHGCLQSQPPAHPQPGPREWMGGAGGAAGEAGLGPGRARRVRGGPTGSAVEKGAPGQLKDTCGLRAQEGAPGVTAPPLSFSQVGNTGVKNTSSGGSAPPGATVPIPRKGGSVPPRSPISSSEGLADTCTGPGGVGVRPAPQPRSPPLPCVSWGSSL